MFFVELREAFLNSLRARVRNGELTERSLAKLVGISQPHMHNVLKGVRTLSPEMLDRFLYQLRLSVFDVVDRAVLTAYLGGEYEDSGSYSYLPVIEGRLGPGHAWPVATSCHERFPVPGSATGKMWHPVVVRVSADIQMRPLFDEGDIVLLDQSHKVRTELDPNALYAIKRGPVGMLRRVRTIDRAVYAVSEDCLHLPDLWERLPVEGQQIAHFVRARATLLAREREWR